MTSKLLVGAIAAAALGVTGVLAGAALANDGSADTAPASVQLDDRGDGSDDDDKVAGKVDDSPTQSADLGTGSAQRITMEQAIDEARAAVPDADVTEVELESEHGRLVWSVELVSSGVEHEVDVDAETGAVTKVESDDDSDDGRDDHGDDHGDDDRGDDS